MYAGPEAGGQYPYALAAMATALEENFGRTGTIDRPLRMALARAQRAALRNDASLQGRTPVSQTRGDVLFVR